MIEKVQMRATKLVDGFGSLSYEDRLRKLELPTLVYRRARGDVIEVYKHLNIYDKDTAPPRFTISRAVRGHDHHLFGIEQRMEREASKQTHSISALYQNGTFFRSMLSTPRHSTLSKTS